MLPISDNNKDNENFKELSFFLFLM
uniref:Uncharacterized protein n=1 Tax=Rhizophora mucronata TaxID=61149 RepID=A0A2P2QYF9_RHIMU